MFAHALCHSCPVVVRLDHSRAFVEKKNCASLLIACAAPAGTLPPGCSLLSAAQGLVAEGGAAALFRGNLVNVMRSAPARAVDFFAFDL
jgi:hypothetical protein